MAIFAKISRTKLGKRSYSLEIDVTVEREGIIYLLIRRLALRIYRERTRDGNNRTMGLESRVYVKIWKVLRDHKAG